MNLAVHPRHAFKLAGHKSRHILRSRYLDQIYPRGIKILGWCPAGPVLPHGVRMPL